MFKNPITNIREARQMSRRELARLSGISYYTLSAIEGGCVNKMQPKTAARLAAFSGKAANDLMDEYATWRQTTSSVEVLRKEGL